MKGISKLSLLVLSLLVSACNEKVAPELTKGEATVPDVAVPPPEYYFSVENTSSALLNYNLHKTGMGNQTAPCEIRSNSALSSESFRGDPLKNDITCYFDAEELSLLYGGMNFAIKSSANSCEYIGYSPFSFFDRKPGDSTGEYTEVECDVPTPPDKVIDVVQSKGLLDNITYQTNKYLGCGEIASKTIPKADRRSFQLADDTELCRFNYEASGGENCDIGKVTITKLQIMYTPATADSDEIINLTTSKRVINCGGKVAACIKGPIQNLTKSMTKATEISETVMNQPFAKEYELEPLYTLENEMSVKTYANFRRELASINIDYGDRNDEDFYKSAFTPSGFGYDAITKEFHPDVMDAYSKNRKLSQPNQELISTGPGGLLDNGLVKYEEYTYTAKPLAAEPFLGIPPYTTNPFYTFYCYDTAYDIKARIRMVVREWDRVSPNFNGHDLISDIGKTGARQDSALSGLNEEIEGEPFNDLTDWDDQIPMKRTPGNWNTNTVWQPIEDGIYTQGWFNPEIFTNGKL